MEEITRTYPKENFKSSFDFIAETDIFLDIETLGFSAKMCPIYLIGIAYLTRDVFTIKLFFANTKDDEADIIKAFIAEAKNYSRIITFNGEGFDIPFIKSRCEKHSIDFSFLNEINSLDLLKAVRSLKKLLGLSKCNQKSVEAFLGIKRDDEYSGGELIEVYKKYCTNKSEDLKKLLILHNFDDVKGMISLLPILAYTKLKDLNFKIDSTDSIMDDCFMIIRGSFDFSLPKAIRLSTDTFYIILDTNKITAAICHTNETLKFFYPYPAKYVYLKNEGLVVPKVLSVSIPSDEKRKPTAEECYSQANGYFIGIDSNTIRKNPQIFADEKIFYENYHDRIGYIKTDPQALNHSWLRQLIGLYLNDYLR